MSIMYKGDHSIDFFNLDDNMAMCKNSWNDFHLIPVTRPYIANARVKLKSESLPLTNYRIDITQRLIENKTYSTRSGSWEFYIDMDKWDSWAQCYRELVQYFHGFRMGVRLKDQHRDDEESLFKGRVYISDYSPEKDFSKIRIDYVFDNEEVSDPSNLNLAFNVWWMNALGELIQSEIYSYGASPSFPGSIYSADDFQSYDIDGNVENSNTVTDNVVMKRRTPDRIRVARLPDKSYYNEEETIDYTGIQVEIQDKYGHIWKDPERYPYGIIPFSELIFPDAIAKYGKLPKVQWIRYSDDKLLSTSVDIFVTTIPYSIVVIKLPDKSEYIDEDTIVFTGIQVEIHDKYGNLWRDPENYPDGLVPFNELTFSDDTAHLDSLPLAEWRRPSDGTTLYAVVGISVFNKPNFIERTYDSEIHGLYENEYVSYIASYAFYGYKGSLAFRFKNVSYIGDYAFWDPDEDLALRLELLSDAVVDHGNSIAYTYNRSRPVSIYVPSTLYSQYVDPSGKWASYSTMIFSISGGVLNE